MEDKLLALVRAGKVDLHTAQQEMVRDWIAAYKKYVSSTRRAAKKSAASYEPDTETVPANATATGGPVSPTAPNPTGQV